MIAAFKLKAWVKAVSCKVKVFPTLRTSIPSVVIPTLNSGCSFIPSSIISAVYIIKTIIYTIYRCIGSLYEK